MKTILRPIAAVMFITLVARAHGSTVYQNDFEAGSASLSDFTSYGTASSQVVGGQLALGLASLNRGGVSLNTASVPGYSTTLSANVGTVTWAFNLANVDGVYNNGFEIILAGNTADPYDFGFPAQGYSLKGGGYVGNLMYLERFDHGLNTYQPLIGVPDTLGLGPLPQMGAVRITYVPSSDTWSLYMDAGLNPGDPTAASQLLGTRVDGTYTHSALPYFELGGEYSGTDYFDNLSISVVPEPSPLSLAIIGVAALCWNLRRSRRAQEV